MASTALLPIERIEKRILLIRGKKVMLDADLAELYGVRTKVLNQAVKRNVDRFPQDYMFELTTEEKSEVVTNCDHLKKLKFSPYLQPPEKPRRQIGFRVEEPKTTYSVKRKRSKH